MVKCGFPDWENCDVFNVCGNYNGCRVCPHVGHCAMNAAWLGVRPLRYGNGIPVPRSELDWMIDQSFEIGGESVVAIAARTFPGYSE